MDLPGLGSRKDEPLTVESAVEAVREIIESQCPEGSAVIYGYSMGGYVAMHFAKKFPELCTALILGGCMNEIYGAGTVMYQIMEATYALLSDEKLASLVPATFDSVDKGRMEKAMTSAFLDYDRWPSCATLMIEPYEGYYRSCLASFDRPVLFVVGENDFRISEKVFLESAKFGKLEVILGGDHMCTVHQDTEAIVHEKIFRFLEEM
jgi:pimeloyl-ACP methyl ester carboxylesterase